MKKKKTFIHTLLIIIAILTGAVIVTTPQDIALLETYANCPGGDVLGRMLLPGDLRAGPMHRIPSLQWKTWVRLAQPEQAGGRQRASARFPDRAG